MSHKVGQGVIFRRFICEACGAIGWREGTDAEVPHLSSVPPGWHSVYTSRYHLSVVCDAHAVEIGDYVAARQEWQTTRSMITRELWPAREEAIAEAMRPLTEWEAANPAPRPSWEKP